MTDKSGHPGKRADKRYFKQKLPLSGQIMDTWTSLHDAWHGQKENSRAAAKRKLNRRARKLENLTAQRLADHPED